MLRKGPTSLLEVGPFVYSLKGPEKPGPFLFAFHMLFELLI